MAERETYHHGDLRQALIEAALTLISEKNVESISLRDVARRVGVSHAAPYRHFADKDTLLAAVATEGFQLLHDALEEAAHNVRDHPLKQLQDIGIAYVHFALSHSSHYRLMFGAYRTTASQQPDNLAEAVENAFMVLVNAIIRGQKVGVMRADDPRQLAQAAWALVHGLAMLLMDGQISEMNAQSVKSLSTAVTQLLIEGIAIAVKNEIPDFFKKSGI